MNYTRFIFERYEWQDRTLRLYYSYDNELHFCETYTFDFDFTDHDPAVLDRATQLLFFVAGVSYYKAFLAPEITVQAGRIDETLAKFLQNTYQQGLGEFFYVNGLDPRTPISFPVNSDTLNVLRVSNNSGALIGLGGGKDSLVSTEILRNQPNVATWSLNHASQLAPLVARVGLPHLYVAREWDPQLKTLNGSGAYNGHVPISAIFACVGTLVAILSGRRDAVVSNEASANEPTLYVDGLAINHQYSKSLEFETSFQAVLTSYFADSLRYYSLLRPYSELRIAEKFAAYFDTYADVFSSCNRAYTHDQDHMFWCGECAKCAFVFLILTPFVERPKLEKLWHGKNLLLDPALGDMYRKLLGIAGDKPFDCVGEIKEARAAMRLAMQQYPELSYEFELPSDYDFRTESAHRIPPEIYKLLG